MGYGIRYISDICLESNSQPVPSQVRTDSTRPQWRMLYSNFRTNNGNNLAMDQDAMMSMVFPWRKRVPSLVVLERNYCHGSTFHWLATYIISNTTLIINIHSSNQQVTFDDLCTTVSSWNVENKKYSTVFNRKLENTGWAQNDRLSISKVDKLIIICDVDLFKF